MRFAALLLCIVPLGAPAQTDARKVAKEYIPRIERNLTGNIIPFWMGRSIDRTNGGYIISHNAEGEPNPNASKGIVTQARQVWLFSKLAAEGYKPKESLEAAQHGFAFLRDKMWDKANGGFYWEVDATGNKPILPKKHMYGQSFALYALSQYYLASQDQAALELADRLFELFETKAYDKEYGGYREFFNPDWTPVPGNERGYMNTPPDLKLMNTHLHLMEAVTTYYRAKKTPLVRARLVDLVNIETSAVVRKDLTACTDKYARDWTPQLQGNYAVVSYGHDIENVWLVIDAMDALELSSYPFVDLFRGLWAYSLKYGYDEQNGGFWYTGAFDQPADGRQKDWWVQAEAIVSALYMYKYTQDSRYLDVFRKTYDFIDKYMTDWEVGEWHPAVSADNKPSGAKAHIWKAGYHNGRAMIESLKLLRSMR
jgi:mannobiose 2-epimerase